jgi:hypothetical protein
MSGHISVTKADTSNQMLQLPVEGTMPPLSGAVDWLNSPPLTAEGLKGKEVLVDFRTNLCINCLRVVPYLRGGIRNIQRSGSRGHWRARTRIRFREKHRRRQEGGSRSQDRLSGRPR